MRFLFKKIKYNIVIFKKMAKNTKDNTKTEKKTTTRVTKKNTKNVKTEDKVKKNTRTFNVYYKNEDINTHPKGKQPRQAARKAITSIIKYMMVKKGITDKKAQKDNKEFLNKKFIFYITEPRVLNRETNKKVTVENPTRHYYIGERTTINPNISYYLSKGKQNEKKIIPIKDYNGRITIDYNGKIMDAKDYKGKDITKDPAVKVIKVEIKRTYKIYETKTIKGPDGKDIKQKNQIGQEDKYIEYNNENIVKKLSLDEYNKYKTELNLSKDEEEELLSYINKPKRQAKPKTETEPQKEEDKKKTEKKDDKEKPAPKRGVKKGKK